MLTDIGFLTMMFLFVPCVSVFHWQATIMGPVSILFLLYVCSLNFTLYGVDGPVLTNNIIKCTYYINNSKS